MLPSNASEFDVAHPPPRRGPNAGLIVLFGLLIVLVAVVVVAVTRLSPGGLSVPSGASAPTTAKPGAAAPTAAVAGTPADAATQAAIQDVIQRLDNAQAQAIASNDPTVMVATATPEFYQTQVATNQDLVANGVTDIKLVNLEWDAITVNGTTATATVYETWSTTFDDGTTEQARDRNVYTLIQDNGTWKVQADDHPDQAAAAPGP